VEQLLLEQLPGYAPSEAWPRSGGQGTGKERAGVLTLGEVEQRFREWLLSDYHHRVQKGQSRGPQERRARGRIFAENAGVVGTVGLVVSAGGTEAASAAERDCF
jgi:hypothetical protein